MSDIENIDNNFKFCPICGKQNIQYLDNRKWGCKDCGFKLYNNVAAAVGLVIEDENGNILFEVRAKEPRKGFLAFPGGFCDPDESAEQAAMRESTEEIGATPDEISYLCSFPNVYDYKNIRYKTCDMFFLAKINSGKSGHLMDQLKVQENEVSSLVSKSIKTEKDIDDLPLAFESAKKTLKLWLKSKTNK